MVMHASPNIILQSICKERKNYLFFKVIPVNCDSKLPWHQRKGPLRDQKLNKREEAKIKTKLTFFTMEGKQVALSRICAGTCVLKHIHNLEKGVNNEMAKFAYEPKL